MKIIDKNTDFYDYYQNVYIDNTFTFDRRDSFVLTKELMCTFINKLHYWQWPKLESSKYIYALLQICNTYWLFSIHLTKFDKFQRAEDYEVELLKKWRNCNKPRKLCNLEIINVYLYNKYLIKTNLETVDNLVKAIDTNNYKVEIRIDKHTIYNGNTKIEKHIPLLKASGLANYLDAHEVYLSFEEYFSLEKTSSERREPLGTTDIDKIESHGFDKKISFRGK